MICGFLRSIIDVHASASFFLKNHRYQLRILAPNKLVKKGSCSSSCKDHHHQVAFRETLLAQTTSAAREQNKNNIMHNGPIFQIDLKYFQKVLETIIFGLKTQMVVI